MVASFAPSLATHRSQHKPYVNRFFSERRVRMQDNPRQRATVRHGASIAILSSRRSSVNAQCDNRSVAELTGDLRAAAVESHDALHNCQPQSCAA
jgi:hypothetical protein